MPKATFELDYLFGSEENQFATRSSFRAIQSAISRLNPGLLRSVIGSGAYNARTEPRSPDGSTTSMKAGAPVQLPALNPASRAGVPTSAGTAPMTIFYNGTVVVFDVPHDKAESILKLAGKGSVGTAGEEFGPARSGRDEEEPLEKLNEELLPIARKKSLQRFLEQRKER